MRDGEGIRNAEFEKRLRDNAIDLLLELDRCAQTLDRVSPDHPRGLSAKALVDRVRGDMVLRPEQRAMPSPELTHHQV